MKKHSKKPVHKKVAKKAVKPISSLITLKIKVLENEIRDIINWLAVFEEEQDLKQGATNKLRERLYKLAQDLGKL